MTHLFLLGWKCTVWCFTENNSSSTQVQWTAKTLLNMRRGIVKHHLAFRNQSSSHSDTSFTEIFTLQQRLRAALRDSFHSVKWMIHWPLCPRFDSTLRFPTPCPSSFSITHLLLTSAGEWISASTSPSRPQRPCSYRISKHPRRMQMWLPDCTNLHTRFFLFLFSFELEEVASSTRVTKHVQAGCVHKICNIPKWFTVWEVSTPGFSIVVVDKCRFASIFPHFLWHCCYYITQKDPEYVIAKGYYADYRTHMQSCTHTHAHTHTAHSERTTENLLNVTTERGNKPMQESCCLTLPPVVNSYQAWWSIETEQQGRQNAENQRASTEIKRAEKWSTFI